MKRVKAKSAKAVLPESYALLVSEIKRRIRSAQYAALRAVNRELIGLYWDIGRLIWARQSGETWGRAIVENLAKDLQSEFPGMAGFSVPNLYKIKQFHEAYRDDQILSPLVIEISWTKNLAILELCKERAEREFYLQSTKRFGWTKSVLIHQIENRTYQKTLRNQTNFSDRLPAKIQKQAKLAVKDEYTFDFLELADQHSERQLEKAILARVEPFLREMGGVFAFVGSQYRLEVGGQEYFIDLLLFHRRLKCLVALDLKVGEFLPEHVGKMQFYLAVLDDKIRLDDESPSIGILICKSKNRTIVEYALKVATKPIGVSTYHMVKVLPPELKSQLPSHDEFARLIA